MRVGINWIFGNPVGPTAPTVVNPDHVKWLAEAQAAAGAPGSSLPPVPKGFAVVPTLPNPRYGDLTGVGISALVLLSILLIARFARASSPTSRCCWASASAAWRPPPWA